MRNVSFRHLLLLKIMQVFSPKILQKPPATQVRTGYFCVSVAYGAQKNLSLQKVLSFWKCWQRAGLLNEKG